MLHPAGDLDNSSDLELTREHDQLPRVEEYKASIAYRPKSKGLRRPDPDAHIGYFNKKSNDDFINDVGEEDEDLIIQVPEFQPKQSGRSQAYTCSPCFWKVCGISSFLMLTAVALTIAYFLNLGDDNHDFWHFLHGETDTFKQVKHYVTNVAALSHIDTFSENSDTPQYYAAQWMAHGDGLKIPVPKVPDDAYDERYALAVFYFSLGGRGWTHQLNFLSDNHICAWYEEFQVVNGKDEDLDQKYKIWGIHRCKRDDDGERYAHTIYMRTSEFFHYFCQFCFFSSKPFQICLSLLSSAANGLNGTIPNEIRGLRHLEYLDIESNPGISGALPLGMRMMESLSTLRLQCCNIGNGPIPSWISELVSLEYLGLGRNAFNGILPSEIGKLTKLELLGLDFNQISGQLDSLKPLSRLKSLYLDNNLLSGSITDSLMCSWPILEELDISGNVLTGELPSDIFNHLNNEQLQLVDLHSNMLAGSLPTVVENNDKLQFLALQENQLEGSIPEGLANLKVLKHLDLSINSFEGYLPASLSFMTNLEYIFLGQNSFDNNTIPFSIIQLTNLRELSMKKSNLGGTIPDSLFHYLTKLDFVDFRKYQHFIPILTLTFTCV
jgi:Leucine-rich repeat (LRR) protein